MPVELFLGGTAGNNHWRGEFIERLVSAGIRREAILNPVVENWDAKARAVEENAKSEARLLLFYIGNPMQDHDSISAYSLVEATMALYDRPAAAVVVFDNSGLTGHALAAMNQCERVLRRRFPDASIFDDLRDAEAFILRHFKRTDRRHVSHGG